MKTNDIRTAALDGNAEDVSRLLSADPSLVSYADENNRTPLHHAATEGHVNIARILWSAGANLDARDRWGHTPLHLAIFEEPLVEDHFPMVNFLITAGANLDLQEHKGDTALHDAVCFHEMEAVAALVRAGANVNLQNAKGDTALHYAAKYRATVSARHLLTRPDLTPDINNNDGESPLDIAVRTGFAELVTLLRAL